MIRWFAIPLAIAAVILGINCGRGAPDSTPMQTSFPGTVADASYFPLSVGNSWTLRCSSEGRFQFEKILRIVAETKMKSTLLFRIESTTTGEAKALSFYMFELPDGTVYTSETPDLNTRQPVVRAGVQSGDHVGTLVVAAIEKSDFAALVPGTEVVRLENFSAEDEKLPADKRIEWKGRSFGRGVGPIVEADGSGNECVLERYHVVRQR